MSDFELVVANPDAPSETPVLMRFTGTFRDVAQLSTRTIVENVMSGLDLSHPPHRIAIVLRIDGSVESQSKCESPSPELTEGNAVIESMLRERVHTVLDEWRR